MVNEYLADYLDYIKYDRDLSANTVILRRKRLLFIFKRLGKREFNLQNIQPLIRELKQAGKSSGIINATLQALSSFCEFLIFKSKLKENFIKQIPRLKPYSKVPDTFSDKELEFLYKFPAHRDPKYHQTDKMWNFLFEILTKTGLRQEECRDLKIGDLDFAQETILIRQTKTKEQRIIPIPPDMVKRLKEWLEIRKEEANDFLFHSFHFPGRKKLSGSGVNKELRRRAKTLGITKRVHAHMFRHSLPIRYLREKVPVFFISRILGHRRLETTMLYSHFVVEDLREAMRCDPLVRQGEDPQEILKRLEGVIKQAKIDVDERFGYRLNRSNQALELVVFIK